MTSPRAGGSPPRVVPTPAPVIPAADRFRLSNGLPVLRALRPGLPVADVRLVLRRGAASDPPARAGRAALAAALLDEGTATRSAPELADALEHLGARLDIAAGWDALTLALHVLTPRLEPALALLGEIAREPAFAPAELERKRAERLAAIAQDAARPGALARDLFHAVVYGEDHPFGVPRGGTEASAAALGRDDLTALHTAHMHGGGAFVVAVGAADADALLDALERALGTLPVGARPRLPAPPSVARGGAGVVVAHRPGAPQSEVRAGHAGPPRASADYFPLLLLNTVLGGAFTSRLNRALREEKGYTYGASSSFAFRRAGGPFTVSVAVATAATADTVREIVAQLERLRQERVGEAELERARNYLALGFPRRLEVGEDYAAQIAGVELHGLGPDYHSRYVERVRSVDGDAVRAAAERHLFPDGVRVAVAGDADAVASPLAALGIGPVLVRPPDAGHFRRDAGTD